MPADDHIFTPADDSLESRVAAYKNVMQAHQNVERSLELAHDEEWGDRLGSVEEIRYAQMVTQNSLSLAAKSLQSSELSQAKDRGLLSVDDLKKINAIKAKSELQEQRQNRQAHTKKTQKTHGFFKK
ncbi:hypothetical protein [Motiliproteus sp. MSK22-1]|uniref:hypothetical protein n=1 Tax=Motiliproteus sp. MSK22-1 TaxID=1897630 RepID=UPI000977ABB9|nr:hypothetical protein [Motiliproteus sp. MSK22-1]OMH28056.1 hypothetical protein BGP75_22070 [Motiliproteus sp. MSK22-1]